MGKDICAVTSLSRNVCSSATQSKVVKILEVTFQVNARE